MSAKNLLTILVIDILIIEHLNNKIKWKENHLQKKTLAIFLLEVSGKLRVSRERVRKA